MSATNTTTNLGLSQFINTDVPAWRGDYNGDMLKIDNAYTADISSATAETSADPSDYMKFYDVSASTNKKILVSDLLKGAKVEDLTDTDITSVANEDGLVYNSTSQKWENKQIVQKNQISNPNLLDNPWFTINQRGAASYSAAGYTVDRWARGAEDVSGHTLTLGDATGTQVTLTEVKGDLYQPLDSHTTYLLSRPYTISAYIDGVLYQHTFTPIADGQTHQIMPDIGVDNLKWNIIENWYAGVHLVGINNFASTTDHYITKIKLELGTFSTLYMDNTPNYAEELLMCQRYYIRIGTGSVAALGMGQAIANNNVCIHIPLTVPIRTSPAINLIGTAFLRNGSTYISSLSSSHVAGDTYNTNEVSFRFVPPLADAVQGAVYECYLDANSYFEIGADL